MSPIYAITAIPAPSGGAVRLQLHTTLPDRYALVLATDHPTAPDPTFQDGARKVHGGRLRYRVPNPTFTKAPHVYTVFDLRADALPDGETVYYHVYEIHPNGTFGAPLTIATEPRCVRHVAVTIARDIVKQRVQYHLSRAVLEGVITNVFEIPLLEQEVRAEGQPLPAVYMKERVMPNPSADTVGHQGGQYVDAHNPDGIKEYRFEYRASVDLLLLAYTPSERTDLEAFLRGSLDADRELFMAAGLEAPTISAFTRHDVDEGSGTDLYGSEISIEAGVTTRVTEAVEKARGATVTR
ncbi:hypothetical protein [Deinococcus sp. UR1]|uniref:hypothetical protein n=1 Tax=Deinococcus sp. UR1 TaxID=1704277 RepID=UPI000C18B071|nr:hypothetical protein [Deinococcus sp. UR1]PIG96864.1 hypothetical protein AMD26_015145 [Deinococcus sp. UR1]